MGWIGLIWGKLARLRPGKWAGAIRPREFEFKFATSELLTNRMASRGTYLQHVAGAARFRLCRVPPPPAQLGLLGRCAEMRGCAHRWRGDQGPPRRLQLRGPERNCGAGDLAIPCSATRPLVLRGVLARPVLAAVPLERSLSRACLVHESIKMLRVCLGHSLRCRIWALSTMTDCCPRAEQSRLRSGLGFGFGALKLPQTRLGHHRARGPSAPACGRTLPGL